MAQRRKLDSDFWNKLCGMIGYILIGISLIGKESIGWIYNYAISIGIFSVFMCIINFIVTSRNKE